MQVMVQTTICDGLAFDPFALEEDGLGPPEVNVSRSEIAEAVVIASLVGGLDEGRDLAFEIAGSVVMLKPDTVLECLMPALDLALGLRMMRRSADMLDVLLVQPIGKIARDIRRAVVRQEPWPVNHVHLIEPGRRQRPIECGGDILRLPSRPELPGGNEGREVVEHGGEIAPAPARDLEIGEVSLPSWLGAVVLSLNSSAALMTM
jgi:hypothetical protein